ncbi:ferulic acid 5-hydroxylase 1, CYTOCHROME P450 84A1 [Hibiscus trionum]|uniref:Ferulic acid 5-hydroxylase 1, CYTOCHROME P450 84A1 n=1 Tax=Hibiscus trionum TaxID=183268 RepID=A0A9W7MD95_HIBTR|nr:ferulic acid 5-hydroxylase 1, CYTOCHROME P450 84A1 [Hibiscus trionum]
MSAVQTMEPLPMALLFVIIPFLFLLRLIYQFRRKSFPPGPKGLPIIGNMLMMDRLTHRGLAKLARRYGGIFHLKMGHLHMVAISNPEMARRVLQIHDNIFSNRPATIAIRYLTYDRADMAFAHYGSFWRQMRKLCVVKLFSRKRAESWESVRDEVENLVKAVSGSANDGKAINVGELIFNLTKNITYRAAFGSISREGQGEFIKILQEFSKLFGAFNVADFIPWLGWVDPQGLNARLEKARFALDKFIDTIIDDHIQKRKRYVNGGGGDGDGGDDTNMVDELLAFYSEEGKVNESDDLNSIRLTRDNIKAIIMDVMFGGTETVASAIEWTLSELMRSSEDMKRVQRELTEVVGLDRRMEESDLDKLPYLKCCLKETLRLHPPIPLLLHETAEEAVVAGYRIPAKSRVMINAWAIGRDKDSWEDPESFKPSRFLKEGVPDFRGGNFEFIPFGSGRRSCPGMQLGLYALDLAVGHLLHCFTWGLPDGMKPSELDMSDEFGLTAPRATRLYAVPKKRLVCPLF